MDRVGGWAACRAPSRPQHGIARWERLKTYARVTKVRLFVAIVS